jgi:hypothetical protein
VVRGILHLRFERPEDADDALRDLAGAGYVARLRPGERWFVLVEPVGIPRDDFESVRSELRQAAESHGGAYFGFVSADA